MAQSSGTGNGEWGLILHLALRNFWRQRRRNASLLLAVAIGMAATLAGGFLIRGWQLSCLLYTSPSPRDLSTSRMPSSA